MALIKGVLKKMITELDTPINYFLSFDNDIIHVNQFINKKIQLNFSGYYCLNCHSRQSIYRMGLCKKCFFESPTTDEWVIRPELSKAHLGEESRDLTYEKRVQLKPHIVYLAYTGDIKVGVTRQTQVPTRWMDQGATYALEIGVFPNRYLAGQAEVVLKKHFSDKTNWRKMLTKPSKDIDLNSQKETIKTLLPEDLTMYITNKSKPLYLEYPLGVYPSRVKSVKLDTVQSFSAQLKGIKGQYLIFDDNHVFNVRNHEGYVVKVDILH